MKIAGLTIITPHGARFELSAVGALKLERNVVFPLIDVYDTGVMDSEFKPAVVASFPSSYATIYRYEDEAQQPLGFGAACKT